MELAYKILHYTCRRVHLLFLYFEIWLRNTAGNFQGNFLPDLFPKTKGTLLANQGLY